MHGKPGVEARNFALFQRWMPGPQLDGASYVGIIIFLVGCMHVLSFQSISRSAGLPTDEKIEAKRYWEFCPH